MVYANDNARASDYGRYVVIEHQWEGSPFYTLYAHLGSVSVRDGMRVFRGQPIGQIGYSGNVPSRDRAHLHFEVNLLLNTSFPWWMEVRRRRARNRHGLYHGSNLAGADAAAFLNRLSRPGGDSARRIVLDQPEDVTVLVPGGPPPDLLRRYPWLCGACGDGPPPRAPAWEVGLTRAGLPVRIAPSPRRLGAPELLTVAPRVMRRYEYSRMIRRRDDAVELSRWGRRHLALLFTRPGTDGVPLW